MRLKKLLKHFPEDTRVCIWHLYRSPYQPSADDHLIFSGIWKKRGSKALRDEILLDARVNSACILNNCLTVSLWHTDGLEQFHVSEDIQKCFEPMKPKRG